MEQQALLPIQEEIYHEIQRFKSDEVRKRFFMVMSDYVNQKAPEPITITYRICDDGSFDFDHSDRPDKFLEATKHMLSEYEKSNYPLLFNGKS